MFMVAVSSHFITVLPGVLRLTCSSANFRHGARVAEEVGNVDPGREASYECMCMRVCVQLHHYYYICTNGFLSSGLIQSPWGVSLCIHLYRVVTGYNF